jgi:hypothetical protein
MIVNILDEFCHRRPLMVAGHGGMQIFPDTLDFIVIGTIGWQEVQADA